MGILAESPPEWQITPSPNPSGASSSFMYGDSCPSATMCAAVGYYVEASVYKSRRRGWNGLGMAALRCRPLPRGPPALPVRRVVPRPPRPARRPVTTATRRGPTCPWPRAGTAKMADPVRHPNRAARPAASSRACPAPPRRMHRLGWYENSTAADPLCRALEQNGVDSPDRRPIRPARKKTYPRRCLVHEHRRLA